MLKLNLGCGFGKLDGFVNVDSAAACAPDLVFDLEQPRWPWETNSVAEVIFNHALEHLGQDSRIFLAMMKELYRVCAPDARITINVPHPRHDNFLDDPTHVRPITPALLLLFDRQLNLQSVATGASNTTLAIHLDVDFVTEQSKAVPTERYRKMLASGEITSDGLTALAAERNNVLEEYRFVLRARKPAAKRP